VALAVAELAEGAVELAIEHALVADEAVQLFVVGEHGERG
jgi:hypothetical protein